MIRFQVSDAGTRYTARFTRTAFRDALIPLAGRIEGDYTASARRPFCVAVAGPPGSGKSTVAWVLEQLLKQRGVPALVLPLDGFHLTGEQLAAGTAVVDGRELPLSHIKGGKETYDTGKLARMLASLRRGEPFWWPAYSRRIHEPVERGVLIDRSASLYLIEGNYLLLREPPWSSLASFFDRRLFILPERRLLRRRIQARKMRGGFTRGQAAAHFRRSDRRNIREVLARSWGWDYLLVQRGRFGYRLRVVKGG
ncbi:MAG: hypothetical protein ACOC8N_04275 [Spirochaetota bacterium]